MTNTSIHCGKRLRDFLTKSNSLDGLRPVTSNWQRLFSHSSISRRLFSSLSNSSTRPKEILLITPLRFHRRQLHVFNFAKGGIRKRYGGTRSLGLKRGSLVKHIKHGICFVGGTSKGLVSLHDLGNQRICQNADVKDIKFLTHSSWRWVHSSPA